MAEDAPLPAAAPGRPGQSYWALVWTQFRQNRLACWALAIIVCLFLLAAWAPVLANGRPIVWRELQGGQLVTSSPLFDYLVAPTPDLSVEYLFNYFFFLSLTGPWAWLVLWGLARRQGVPLRAKRRWCAAGAGAALVLAAVPFAGPGTYQRTETLADEEASERADLERDLNTLKGDEGATPGLRLTVRHWLRRYRLDRRYYLARQYDLDAARGEYALFPPIAQDPIKPTGEILHPWGPYRFHKNRYYREVSPAALNQPGIGNVRRVCLTGKLAGVEGEMVKLEGVEARIRCGDGGVAARLAGFQPGDELWLAGHHVTLREDGQPLGAELELLAVERARAPLPRVWHLLGTDAQGRDVLARMIHGARISISVGYVSVAIAVLIGIFVGGLAGYYRGWVDIAISRLIELVICFPTFFLIITIIAYLDERSIFHVMLVIGATGWTGVARLVRGEFLKLSEQDFVHAARALGCSGRRIMFRHILPNALGPVLVSAAFGVAGAVLTESSLAFLGFGVIPPTPTWGELISQGKTNIAEGAWWLFSFPGILLFLTVTVYTLAGEGLRDAMDPRLRK